MSYVDDIKRAIEDALAQSDENLDWIEANGPVIIDHLLEIYLANVPAGGWVANPIADRAKEELLRAVRFGRQSVACLRAEIQYIGSPDNLRAAADTIDTKMIEPARELASTLVLAKIPSALESNYSDGSASEGYRVAIDGRDDAVRGIETYAAPVAAALRDLATGIEDYYTGLRDLALELLALVISIVVLVVGWETIVLGVLGIVGIVVSIVKLGFTIADMISTSDETTASVREAFDAKVPAWPAVLTA